MLLMKSIFLISRIMNATLITPIIVFSGELVINYSAYDLSKFNNIIHQIIEIDNYNNVTSFGYT